MKVFVLRDSQGKLLEHNVDIGPLFDIAAKVESTTNQETSITAEELDSVINEQKHSINNLFHFSIFSSQQLITKL